MHCGPTILFSSLNIKFLDVQLNRNAVRVTFAPFSPQILQANYYFLNAQRIEVLVRIKTTHAFSAFL